MKKLRKILTLCLALVMMLGVMSMPVSANDYMYVVWTEDEFWDLSNPRPVPPANTNVYMLIVTKGDDFDYDKANANYETYLDHIFQYVPTCIYTGTMNSFQPTLDAAMEAYNRIDDPEYKAIIIRVFELDIESDYDFAANLTEESVYQAMIALKSSYPEGMRWTDDDYYGWRGNAGYSGGTGCAGFAFMLSDAAFSYLFPARQIDNVSLSDVRVGDILRINKDTHSVIVLEVKSDRVVIAEGNYGGKVHWGRTLSKAQVEAADYMLTRWPEGSAQEPQPADGAKPSAWAQPEVTEATQAGLVPDDLLSTYTSAITREEFCRLMVKLVEANSGKDIASYAASQGKTISAPFTDTSAQEVKAAYTLGIVNGTSATTFSPNGTITRQEAAAMLERTAKLLGLSSGESVSFADSGSIASWASGSVAFVSGLTDPVNGGKVMGGVGNNSFGPTGTYTREQAIATSLRLFHCAA